METHWVRYLQNNVSTVSRFSNAVSKHKTSMLPPHLLGVTIMKEDRARYLQDPMRTGGTFRDMQRTH